MTDPNEEPGRSRRPDDLEDAGPALRISERQSPAGPALQAEIGRGSPVIEGPPEDISIGVARDRAAAARRERLLPALGVSALLLVAAFAFWSSGAQRGDGVLQALGALLAALAVGAALLGAVLGRRD